MLERHPEADKNGDGRVSPDEARAFFEANPQVMREEFLRRNPELDTDKDGKLSDEEMRAARARFDERRREEMLRRNPELDTDKDGKLSEEEMQAARAQFAERFRQDMLRRNPEADKDGDGKLSDEEMDALRQSFRSRWGGRPGPDGRRWDGPQEPQGGQGPGPGPGGRAERRDPRASVLGRAERDPWAQYVAEFSARYKLDASQQNSAMSILKDYTARRAKLQAGQDAASIAEKKKAEDALFKEMKERLDQIPTTAQRNAVPTQVQTPTSKPA